MAVSYNELGRSDGIAYGERALAIYEELGDFAGMGHTLNNLGIGFYYAGRWDEAVASYRRGREALDRAGDVVGEATLANNEGEILSDQGRLEDAEAPFRHFGAGERRRRVCARRRCRVRQPGSARGQTGIVRRRPRVVCERRRDVRAHRLGGDAPRGARA